MVSRKYDRRKGEGLNADCTVPKWVLAEGQVCCQIQLQNQGASLTCHTYWAKIRSSNQSAKWPMLE